MNDEEDETQPPNPSSEDARTAAKRWVWLRPGVGFAKIGRPVLAVTSFAGWAAAIALCWWFLRTLDPVARVLCGTVFGGATLLWLVELFAVRAAKLRPPAPAFLAESRAVPLAYLAVGGGALVAAIVLHLGSVKMAGNGMAPTLPAGEQVFYWKRTDDRDLRRGTVVTFRKWDEVAWEPKALYCGRVAAVPGDRLSTSNGRYVVGDEIGPPVGKHDAHKPLIEVPPAPGALVVPEGCYFVCQDNPNGSLDSSVLGWAKRAKIVSTRAWYLRRDRLLERVE